MSSIINKLSAFLRDEEGLTTVEYAIAGVTEKLSVMPTGSDAPASRSTKVPWSAP
jgi:hypothetical protein